MFPHRAVAQQTLHPPRGPFAAPAAPHTTSTAPRAAQRTCLGSISTSGLLVLLTQQTTVGDPTLAIIEIISYYLIELLILNVESSCAASFQLPLHLCPIQVDLHLYPPTPSNLPTATKVTSYYLPLFGLPYDWNFVVLSNIEIIIIIFIEEKMNTCEMQKLQLKWQFLLSI